MSFLISTQNGMKLNPLIIAMPRSHDGHMNIVLPSQSPNEWKLHSFDRAVFFKIWGLVHLILPRDIPAMCPGSMPLYGVSTSSVQGSPVDALEIWLTLLVGELFRLFFEVINTFTFFKPEKSTTNTQKPQPLELPHHLFALFWNESLKKGSLVINVTRTPGMGSIPNIRRTWTCECPPPTKTKSLMMGVLATCVAKKTQAMTQQEKVMQSARFGETNMTEIGSTKFHPCYNVDPIKTKQSNSLQPGPPSFPPWNHCGPFPVMVQLQAFLVANAWQTNESQTSEEKNGLMRVEWL